MSSSGLVDVSSREVSVVGVDRLEAYGGEEVRVTEGRSVLSLWVVWTVCLFLVCL